MKKRLLAMLLVLVMLASLIPVGIFAATISTMNITTSTPVGGQWPPFDAKLTQTGNYKVNNIQWEGEFDEYGRCKNGETYVGHFFFVPLVAWDALSTRASVTINGITAKVESSSTSQKLEATVSFTAQQGEVKTPKFTAVEKFATGDCGLATSEDDEILRSTPDYYDYNDDSPRIAAGEDIFVIGANSATYFHTVLYNGGSYYYYDPAFTQPGGGCLSNYRRFDGVSEPTPEPEPEPEPEVPAETEPKFSAITSVYGIEYAPVIGEQVYSIYENRNYTTSEPEFYPEVPTEPFSWARAVVTYTAAEGKGFDKEAFEKDPSEMLFSRVRGNCGVEKVERIDYRTLRVTYIAWIDGEKTDATERMLFVYNQLVKSMSAKNAILGGTAEIYNPVVGGVAHTVHPKIYSYPCTGLANQNYGTKVAAGTAVKIVDIDVSELIPGLVGDWSLVCAGSTCGFIPTAFLTNVQKYEWNSSEGASAKPVNSDFVFEGGSGTYEDPYLIATAEQLNAVRKGPSFHYKLIADIDLSNWGNWIPFGCDAGYYNVESNETGRMTIAGSIDGDGHVISGMNIVINAAAPYGSNKTHDTMHFGLAGFVGNAVDDFSLPYGTEDETELATQAGFRNLGIINYKIKVTYTALTANITDMYVGAFAGMSGNMGLYNCYAAGGEIKIHLDFDLKANENATANVYAAGLIGDAGECDIRDCYNTSPVTISSNTYEEAIPNFWAAGITTGLSRTFIRRSFNTGAITVPILVMDTGATMRAAGIANHATWPNIPGLYNHPKGSTNYIFDCYNTGIITGNLASGIINLIKYDTYLERCYNVGKLVANTAKDYAHATQLVGVGSCILPVQNQYILNCYSNGTSVSGAAWQNSATLGRKVLKSHPEEGTKTVRPIVVAQIGGFKDVKANAWYGPAVAWAVRTGITTGTNDGTTFSPDWTCTRAQILTFLWRAVGQPEPTIANPFTDVTPANYYYKPALWAYENGMVTGKVFAGETTPCTRASTVIYLWQYAGSPKTTPTNAFKDVAANAEYAQAVAWAVANGITTGTNDGTTFSPDWTCTRGQIVTFLIRAVK